MKFSRSTLSEESIFSTIGIAVEYYNVFVFGYLSSIISPHFIPSSYRQGLLWVILSALLISAPFLGAMICGHVADKLGRKKVLAWTISFVSIPSFLISILPGYEQWGVLSFILFFLFRFVQIFAFGGDMVGLLTFVLEEVPNQEGEGRYERGKYGGFMSTGAGLGVALATGLIAIYYPSHLASVANSAWRILLCIGGIGIFVAAYFHIRIHETAVFDHYDEVLHKKTSPIKNLFLRDWKGFVQVLGMSSLAPIITIVVFGFFPYQVGLTRGFTPRDIMVILTVSLVLFSVLAPIFGSLSDRFGRNKLLKGVCLALFAVSAGILYYGRDFSTGAYVLLQFVLIMISSAYYGVTFTASSETFPTHIRYTGVSLGYAVTYSIFGESFGLFVTNLLEKQPIISRFDPFIYLMFGCVIVFLTMSFRRETSFSQLRENE